MKLPSVEIKCKKCGDSGFVLAIEIEMFFYKYCFQCDECEMGMGAHGKKIPIWDAFRHEKQFQIMLWNAEAYNKSKAENIIPVRKPDKPLQYKDSDLDQPE